MQVWVSATTTVSEGRTTPRVSATLTTTSSYPPVAVGGDHILRVGVGGGVTLGCRGLGSPSPDVKWSRNGEPVSRDHLHQPLPGGDLHITGK